MFIKQPFDEFLGLKYKKIDDHRLEIILPVQDLFINSAGVIHGGIISSLADVAVSNLLPANEDGIQQAVTVDLNVTFLKPAAGTYLIANASLEKLGKTLVHTECSIYNDKQEMVAKSKAILFRTQLNQK
ncbi:PaaI family thioesterase [Neobacillus dielmonensis]|uniref:PaaI family thioesterase n=1 Tax=Neobacillus dielmonensis TaxID=1347369 RepID=UPI0005A636EB|nr:PaaI family thioesterase [Neobacillus dielmonensis]